MSTRTSTAVCRRIIYPFVVTILFVVFLSACGGLSSSDKSMVLETLNDMDEIVEKNASIGDITFEDKQVLTGPRGDYDSWPFEATIVDKDSKQIGVIKGHLAKQGSSAMVVTSPVKWD